MKKKLDANDIALALQYVRGFLGSLDYFSEHNFDDPSDFLFAQESWETLERVCKARIRKLESRDC